MPPSPDDLPDELPSHYQNTLLAYHPKYTKRKAQRFPVSPGKRFKMGPTVGSKADQEERSQLIVRFYDPKIKARDTRRRTLEDILSWPDSTLESCHNYIQMLFPLPEGSFFNLDTPVVDVDVMQAFHSRDDLRQQLRRSFERMLTFYGFQVSTEPETKLEKTHGEQKVVLQETQKNTSLSAALNGNASASNAPPYNIIRGSNWHDQCQNWAVQFDHNHLRISRIIRCLRVLGLEREATAFFAALERTYKDPQLVISAKSMKFWRSAATRPLHIAPDDEKCDWLETWEKEQESSDKSVNPDGEALENQEDDSSA
ncbi:uncharacterized protein yc1106_07544 [Curvularia clavata]|uniref:Opioid growth factor receptor (OGFr) conserved domain-containing protein n=1 Tax=Curvularia clavata TaxID=95742 RepID=A0A9Q8ZEI8_CURCL|nr:uncharacterized protein yc1106_07544 [Curvularia clavata]